MDATVAAAEAATDGAALGRPAAVRGPARGAAPAVADLGRVAPAEAGPSPVAGPNRAVPASPPNGPAPAPTNPASATPSPNRDPAPSSATAAAAGPSPRTPSHAAAAPAPGRAPSPRITNPAAARGRRTRVPARGEVPVVGRAVVPATGHARRQTNGTENPGRRRPRTTTTRPSATKAWTTRRNLVVPLGHFRIKPDTTTTTTNKQKTNSHSANTRVGGVALIFARGGAFFLFSFM